MEEREEESTEQVNERKLCRINTKLLPFKIHYFFTYGGSAAVIPFLPIVAKQIGINATALGIGYSLIPIFTLLFNPITGFLVDYFQNVKVFLIVLLISSSLAFASVVFIPAITYDVVNTTYIQISYINETEALFNISKPFDSSCIANILQNHTECELKIPSEKETNHNNETNGHIGVIDMTFAVHQINDIIHTEKNTHWLTFYIKDTLPHKEENNINSINIHCSPSIHHCSINESHDVFVTYQYWIFFILIVFASIANMSANSLSSVACFELLGTKPKAYGRQRLFGTIGWGIVGALSGLLNDVFERSFISMIYLIAVLRTIDIIILCLIPLPKANASSNMNRDLRIIFTSKEILVFSSGIAFIGFLAAIIIVFEFWFLEDMGASRTLLGLSVLMQCLVGEVPFLFFSGWFVNKLGHFLCFTYVFLGFLLRLVFYYFVNNPWMVLPIDTLHGVTFGLFHGTMASFAKEKAPKGMEATLLGFFGALYNGLGYGLGSFLGGFGLDKIGPRKTFLSASMLSVGCFLLFLSASYIFRVRTRKFQPVSLEIEEIPANT